MNPGSKQHYDSHLAAVYSWMAGGAEAAIERNRKFFEAHVGRAKAPARPLAVDLGCGSGFQSIPLAELGYRVLAIDNCPALLAELSSRRGPLPIQSVDADLTKFRNYLNETAELIVCLGDTLTHLPSLEAVAALIRDMAAALAPGGRCLLGFRDYVSRELVGEQRFIPVRSDDNRILTCFLEYHPDHVLVHDLLHERSANGWTQCVSTYRKLRLDPAWVVGQILSAGFSLGRNFVEEGMTCLLAEKPASS